MSGARLCGLLGELGYEAAQALDPDSFEWPFQYDDARSILDWICSSLRPSNVLSPSELSQYGQFLEEGKLLEGEDLDSAYDSISAFSSRRDNQDALFGGEEGLKEIREATLAYKSEALELQRQLRHLQSQYDLLTSQASNLTQGRRARVAATSSVNGQLTSIDDSISARNLEMNAVLGRIASTAQELAHYHSGDEDGIYLAYSDFHPYLVGDSSCTKELNQWFSKQLDTGPYRLVAEEGKSKCSWVSLDDMSNILVRDLETSHHQRVSELQRLRSMVKNGEKISFWRDKWVGNAPLKDAFPDLFLISLKKEATVADCWNKDQNNWDLGFQRGIMDREFESWPGLISLIDPIRLGDGIDRAYWSLENSGKFSTRSTFIKLVETTPNIKTPLIKVIWKSLNTQDRLQCKFSNLNLSPSVCVLCFNGEESVDHLFLRCNFTIKGWEQIMKAFEVNGCLPKKMLDWLLEALNGWGLGGKSKILWKCVTRALV